MPIVIFGCQPQIVARNGAEVTVRLRGGSEEAWAFAEACKDASLTSAQHFEEYARKHGIPLDTPVQTD